MKFGFGGITNTYNISLSKEDLKTDKHRKRKYARIRPDRTTISIQYGKEINKETLNNLYFIDEDGNIRNIQFLNIIIED